MAVRTRGGLDAGALRRAIEGRDPDLMLGLYADDAEMSTVNRNDTPSRPRKLRGREEISAYLRDVFGREMTHRVENLVAGEDRLAFTEACEYPDGTKVLAAVSCELRDGKIARQLAVEAWDE